MSRVLLIWRRILIEIASDGIITIQKAAEKAGMDVASFKKRMKEQYEDETRGNGES